ncbi:MAG: FHA domain-containing protein [Xenococcaceae cyanobacterium MO_188.B29]|nr:FHA domain-containing protein [Xenococcaceae cyanobacterium MO_188.B29]
MAIVKCKNPACPYYDRTVPEGEFCPHCGEALNLEKTSPQKSYTPLVPDNADGRTYVELPQKLRKNRLTLNHSNSGQTFTIDSDSATNKIYLGRQVAIPSVSVIDMSDLPFAERISHLHAYVTWDNNRNCFTITDNDSTNGTILNGKSLIPQQPYPLNPGDRLEFGREHKIIFTGEISET